LRGYRSFLDSEERECGEKGKVRSIRVAKRGSTTETRSAKNNKCGGVGGGKGGAAVRSGGTVGASKKGNQPQRGKERGEKLEFNTKGILQVLVKIQQLENDEMNLIVGTPDGKQHRTA